MVGDEEIIAEVVFRLDYGREPECMCGEKGSDGTGSHDKFSGWVIHNSGYQYYPILTPCKNHIQNYLRHDIYRRRAVRLGEKNEH